MFYELIILLRLQETTFQDNILQVHNGDKHKKKHFIEIGADHGLCSICNGETESDLWVECDECKAWQHQLCCG